MFSVNGNQNLKITDLTLKLAIIKAYSVDI